MAPFHNTLATALLAAHRGVEALPHFDAAVESATRSFGAGHANTLNARGARALALSQAGRVEEARREAAGALEVMRTAGGPAVVGPLLAGGILARRDGAGDRARSLLDEAAELAAQMPATLWQVLAHRGLLVLDEGRASAAVPDLARAVSLIDELRLEGTPDVVEALEGLGRALSATERPAEAAPYATRATRMRAKHPAWPPVVAQSPRSSRR